MNRTDDEQFIIGSIFLLSNKLSQIGDKILPDITFKQFILLITVHKMTDANKNMNSIAEIMGTTRQNIKKMLSSLEVKGYISMTKSKQDARAFDIELTETTMQYFIDNATNAANEAHLLFNSFSLTEIHAFASTLTKLLSSIENYHGKTNYYE